MPSITYETLGDQIVDAVGIIVTTRLTIDAAMIDKGDSIKMDWKIRQWDGIN